MAPAFLDGRPPSLSGHASAAPYGFAGSAAARTRVDPSPGGGPDPSLGGVPEPSGDGAESPASPANDRRRSTAPGGANWAAPRPSTK